MRWIELARRWADKCRTCGETDQRLVTFSQCIHCRVKERKDEEEKTKKVKDQELVGR
jgi:hypothetical protein